MIPELVLAYLDDITLGDDVETVMKDVLQLEEAALHISLEINREPRVLQGLETGYTCTASFLCRS